jgi:hypothetical protein
VSRLDLELLAANADKVIDIDALMSKSMPENEDSKTLRLKVR